MDRSANRWFDVERRSSEEFVGLDDVARFLRLHLWSIAGCLAIGVALAWAYVTTSPPTYTASAQILIEPRIPQLVQQPSEVNLSLDTAQVESQMALMRSEKIALTVIDALKLADAPEFRNPAGPSIRERLQEIAAIVAARLGIDGRLAFAPWHGDGGAMARLSEFERSRLIMSTFSAGLDVRRVGVSYAVSIAFSSSNPEMAARIANAVADAFVREQVEAKAAAARESGIWLEKRLRELRAQMNLATQAVQAFRSRHDYSVGPSTEGVDPNADPGIVQEPTLDELEVTADTYRKMYESVLNAYTNSESQQSYAVPDARVITKATTPLDPSAPRRRLLLLLGGLAGLMAGLLLAFLRQTLDRTVRTPRQIRQELGLECVGELPPIGARRSAYLEAAKHPNSQYCRSLRRAKAAISLWDGAHPIRRLGVVSVADREGRSIVASNLAALYSAGGRRTMIVDADMHRAELTKVLAGASPLTEDRSQAFRRVVVSVGRWFDLLPGTASGAEAVLAASPAYDLVIVDLPAFTAECDVPPIGAMLDGVVLVARWGRTPVDLLRQVARSVHASKTPIVGVILTDVRTPSGQNATAYGS